MNSISFQLTLNDLYIPTELIKFIKTKLYVHDNDTQKNEIDISFIELEFNKDSIIINNDNIILQYNGNIKAILKKYFILNENEEKLRYTLKNYVKYSDANTKYYTIYNNYIYTYIIDKDSIIGHINSNFGHFSSIIFNNSKYLEINEVEILNDDYKGKGLCKLMLDNNIKFSLGHEIFDIIIINIRSEYPEFAVKCYDNTCVNNNFIFKILYINKLSCNNDGVITDKQFKCFNDTNNIYVTEQKYLDIIKNIKLSIKNKIVVEDDLYKYLINLSEDMNNNIYIKYIVIYKPYWKDNSKNGVKIGDTIEIYNTNLLKNIKNELNN